jgi:flagellar basal-body rod protein FlgB
MFRRRNSRQKGGCAMVVESPNVLNLLSSKMSYLNKAQVVHAENVANANTPGYKPSDVAPFSFGDALKQAGVTMAVTDPRHIVPASLAQSNAVAVKPKGTARDEVGDVEQEALKVSQVGTDYQLATTLFHKIAGWFRIAVKGG